MKLVLCKPIHYPGDEGHCLKVVRASTQRGHKKYWARGPSSGFWTSVHLSNKPNGRGMTSLLWQGDDNQFLIFKLKEPTGIVQDIIDIDTNCELWIALKHLDQAYSYAWDAYLDQRISRSDCEALQKAMRPMMIQGMMAFLRQRNITL